MYTEQVNELLGVLSGHLQADQVAANMQELQDMLERSLLSDDVSHVKGSRFAYETADLFRAEQIAPERAAALKKIAEQKTAENAAAPEYRVFVREVPVRSTQLYGSFPLWASGAQVERTLGPFTNVDGRQFWFDFFRIERLVALYVQGSSEPALLFHVSLLRRFLERLPPPISTPSYSLPAGSIWINSQLLVAGAPAGYFTGLTIKGGTISLSAAPQVSGDKITVTSTTTVRISLDLDQPAVTGADPSSPYGIDARNAALELPAHFEFHFSGSGRTFDTIADARWTLYGNAVSFHWKAQAQPGYNDALHRVLIPFTYSQPDFTVADSQSPFFTLRGKAPVAAAAWALPAAPIDIANPTPAAGDGGMVVACSAGLTSVWQKLDGGELAFQQPYVLLDPGHIAITDLAAASVALQQTLNLWRDQQNRFGSAIALQFPNTMPFFYNSIAQGIEVIFTTANANVQADRPVTVAGQALAILSKNSLFLLSASKTLRLVYLFDDNILLDNAR